ncbi:MAG: hypothetical protein Q7T71_02725 [Herbiconiux sp.]|nr:hypothetical protein [Herbiconiux sp.]
MMETTVRPRGGSLVQQRAAIERMRGGGVWLTVVGVAALLGGLWLLTTTPSGPVIGLVVAATLIGSGVRQQVGARRRLVVFEAEHGAGAGLPHPLD